MSAAGSPSVKILLKRKAEQSQSSNEAAGKKLRIVDKLSFCNDPTVTLKVGPDLLPFHVHQNLLCKHSPFFAAAFNGSFKESAGSMELREDDPEAFDRFLQWLYRRDFTISPIGDKQCTSSRYQELVRVYILADKLDVPLLKNRVMVSLFDTVTLPNGNFRWQPSLNCRFRPRSREVKLVYTNTVKGSPIRNFMAAYYAWYRPVAKYEEEHFWDHNSDIPDFLNDVSINLARRSNNRTNPLLDVNNFMEPVPDDGVTED
ncbi:MAG: hypothetical protein LQ349_007245 [Xanthoria aureola]|nr:MAG: hypothetical protein LQ349_007245 [Xanthoria aureola]